MKSLVRWSATVGLVGTTLIGSLLAGSLQALALTQDQILKKLEQIPVFTIANAQGAPLVAAPPQGQKGAPVAGVFISQRDAQTFLDNLKSKNPSLAQGVRVVPVSMAEVYKLEQANKSKPERLDFAFVPVKQQQDTALALLKQTGQSINEFPGVPLFVAVGGAEKGFLTIQRDNKEQIIPLFFNKEDLQSLIDRFKREQPNQTVEVRVLFNLQGLINTWQSKNDPAFNQMVLIPPRDSLEYLRTLQPGSPQARPQLNAPANNTRPAPAPAPAPQR